MSRTVATSSLSPKLPHSGGQGIKTPWGGQNESRWRPEAILANAASAELNASWQTSDIQDVIVSVPVKMLRSQFRPYGDGQSNAVASFGDYWKEKRPPLVAVLLLFKGGTQRIQVQLDRKLSAGLEKLHLQYSLNGQAFEVKIKGVKSTMGDVKFDWTPPAELGLDNSTQSHVFFVQPGGGSTKWNDWFPISFRHPVSLISSLLQHIPDSSRSFKDGRPLVDPEEIVQRGKVARQTPFETVVGRTFGPGYNATPYNPQSIHAEFPGPGATITAVGQGWTWVADRPQAPFKVLYTCFERRRLDLELSAKDGGVPTGGGWHEIGDFAETILNSLEKEAIAVGWASTLPSPTTPTGTFSYGLSDVATIRWLQPGEAMITTQSNFHWFIFQGAREVCTEEWVHPCLPTPFNHWGFEC